MKKEQVFFLIFAIKILFVCPIFAQTDSISSQKFKRLAIWSGVGYTASMIGLSELWYANSPRQSFRWFNDNLEWQQMDKLGHSFSTYQLTNFAFDALKNTGISEKKAVFYASSASFLMLSPIEIFDGYSANYGASWGDLLANFSGSALFASQYFLWKEQRIYPKFSFHTSNFASQRPNTLGKSFLEQVLKDYNGQTYWYSIDLYAFTKKKAFKYLNLAFGYSGSNMLYAQDSQNLAVDLVPYRRFFVGLDIHLGHIPTKNKFLKKIFSLVNMIHLPAPTLEYNHLQGWIWHNLYF
ncbi:MAG: DUF2279 domain-containing protein [Bacteroidetes bacterium]|nr:MAG: DUF2279 domain-containing protein [Bacteroidota bacterium]